MIDTGLKRKNILITGANNPDGIGAAITRAFAQERASVFLHYKRLESPTEMKEREEPELISSPGEAYYARQSSKGIAEVLDRVGNLSSLRQNLEGIQSDWEKAPCKSCENTMNGNKFIKQRLETAGKSTIWFFHHQLELHWIQVIFVSTSFIHWMQLDYHGFDFMIYDIQQLRWC